MANKRTTRKSARTRSAARRTAGRAAPRTHRSPHATAAKDKDDILRMLTDDHERVKALFRKFAKMKADGPLMSQLVQQACRELEIHATLEERIFYPAVRDAIRDRHLVDEAMVEHDSAKRLIADLKQLDPHDPRYAATFVVLAEHVKRHIEEEENRVFPQVHKARIDRAEMARQTQALRREFTAEQDQEIAAPIRGEGLGQRRGESRHREVARH